MAAQPATRGNAHRSAARPSRRRTPRIIRGLVVERRGGVDIVLLAKAAVMGIVEGLTEFLPISSTGHLILAGSLLGMTDEKAKVFDIAIQSGAMLAVILVYWQRLRDTVAGLGSSAQARAFVANVAIAFAPAVVLGLLFGKVIKAHLFNAPVVAASLHRRRPDHPVGRTPPGLGGAHRVGRCDDALGCAEGRSARNAWR